MSGVSRYLEKRGHGSQSHLSLPFGIQEKSGRKRENGGVWGGKKRERSPIGHRRDGAGLGGCTPEVMGAQALMSGHLDIGRKLPKAYPIYTP